MVEGALLCQAGGAAARPGRTAVAGRFDHPGLGAARAASLARFRAGLAALLRRPARGQSRLHRRLHQPSAVADHARRGRGHPPEGGRDVDRRQQFRRDALGGGGHGAGDRRDPRGTARTPAADAGAAAGRAAEHPQSLDQRADGPDQPGAGGARLVGNARHLHGCRRHFHDRGRVDPSRFLDPHLRPPDPPLHPTAQSQGRIAEAIEPTLARMLGDESRVRSPRLA